MSESAEASGGEPVDDVELEPDADRADRAPGRRLSEEERRRYEAFKAEVFGRRCSSDGC